jgi:hypothetical protein
MRSHSYFSWLIKIIYRVKLRGVRSLRKVFIASKTNIHYIIQLFYPFFFFFVLREEHKFILLQSAKEDTMVKVKLSCAFFLTEHHTTKAYWGVEL